MDPLQPIAPIKPPVPVRRRERDEPPPRQRRPDRQPPAADEPEEPGNRIDEYASWNN